MKNLSSRFVQAMIVTALATAPIQVQAQDSRVPAPAAEAPRARNVILFLADAGGVPVLNGASLMAYGEPLRLRIQQWPHLGLSETSPVDDYVSDSANGMSAIMTGVKTRNGVISQTPDAVRGQKDGAPAKTLLEYAEERGLMTGVITNMSIADATPAATYAHANDRKKWGEIFAQAFAPRFGDGVDLMFGAGRRKIAEQLAARGSSFEALSTPARPIYASLAEAPATARRPVVVADTMDVRAATLRAIEAMKRSPGGYFLVVEWDAHTDDPREGLQNLADFDRLVAEVERQVDLSDTLLLFTADHSFGFQVDGGRRGTPLLEGYEAWKAQKSTAETVRLKHVFVSDTHTAEEVPALATGAGAERVRGYFPNTHLFDVMLNALGWKRDLPAGK